MISARHQLLLMLSTLVLLQSGAQTMLTSRQIAQAQAWGRTTDHSLRFGTFADLKGEKFDAFILSPIQRIAYTTSEEASTHHRDILKDELNLNRMRVAVSSFDQHQPRSVTLVSADSRRSLKPARLVFEMNVRLADAEFEMPAVITLSKPTGRIFIETTDENGVEHHPIPFNLETMNKVVGR